MVYCFEAMLYRWLVIEFKPRSVIILLHEQVQ